jgi:hypothetical protein
VKKQRFGRKRFLRRFNVNAEIDIRKTAGCTNKVHWKKNVIKCKEIWKRI